MYCYIHIVVHNVYRYRCSHTYMHIQQGAVHECTCNRTKNIPGTQTNANSSAYVLTMDASARVLNFSVQLTTSRFGNLTRLIHIISKW